MKTNTDDIGIYVEQIIDTEADSENQSLNNLKSRIQKILLINRPVRGIRNRSLTEIKKILPWTGTVRQMEQQLHQRRSCI